MAARLTQTPETPLPESQTPAGRKYLLLEEEKTFEEEAWELLSFLKPPQWDLFALIAHEQSLDQMCAVLGMNHRTLRQEITRLYEDLDIPTDHGQAIRRLYPVAQEEGWLD